MDIDASFETSSPTKPGHEENARSEENQTPKLFDHYPLTALCAEQSKRAKSNLEIQKWAFFSGYLLAKEEKFGFGTSSKHKNATEICEEVNKPSRPYLGPITRSKAHLMSQSIIDDSSNYSTSSDTEKIQSSIRNPLYGDLESIFQEEDFPKNLMDQFDKVLNITDESDSEYMPVLVTGTTSLEEQLQELQRKLIEKDAEIAALAARMASQASSSAQTHVPATEEGHTSSNSITQEELKSLIAEGIREFQASINPPVLGYRKPYPAHYDTIPFPTGYQKPNFEKFDGLTGSPQEHLAHFYSACGESALSDALLIRQFVQSLKGSAFTWYTQLQPGSIHTWDDLQRAFLAQFVSSKKKVSIIDLADAQQKSNESVNDFITRWRSLNL